MSANSLQYTTLDGRQWQFNFVTASTPEGAIVNMNMAEEEELTTPGVDGMRWRLRHFQYQPFTLQTTQDFANEADTAIAQAYCRLAVGRTGTLSLGFRGFVRTWNYVHIAGCMPKIVPGPLFGIGATSGSAMTIVATWTLRLTQTSGGP